MKIRADLAGPTRIDLKDQKQPELVSLLGVLDPTSYFL
jgi:hypothetical protein